MLPGMMAMDDSQSGNRMRIAGYFPGAVGRITELHATYYYEHWGLDVSFEAQVGRELSEFVGAFQKGRDGLWVATCEGELSGSIAIDGRKAHNEGARLRWYIVAPKFQRRGLGLTLLREAIQFCGKAGYKKIYLWTFRGLDTARRLYEQEGFRISEEHEVPQWGVILTEQKFELILP